MPESCRFAFWRWAIGRELDYNIFEPLHGGDTLGYYLHHRALLTDATNKKTSGQLGEIMRDVGRTYPDHPFFSSKKNQPGEILLARILCATLSSTPNIGYCQGMNFVVATLLLARIPKDMMEASYCKREEVKVEHSGGENESIGEDDLTIITTTSSVEHSTISEYDDIEADVFWMFQSILIKNDRGLEMEFIWKPTFPKMKLRVFQFDRLLELYLPALHRHFEDMNLSPEVVVSQWFMTLFSNTLPMPFTFHMWDYVFVANWPGIFRATLAILYVLQERLLEMDLEEVGLLIRDWKRGKFDIPVSFSELLGSAETFDIDLNSLVMLQETYAVEMIVAAIGDQLDMSSSVGKSYHGGCMGLPRPGGDSWLRRYGEFPEEMRAEMLLIHNAINEQSVQVDKDKAVLQNKILKACELCEHAYDDLDKALREEMQWLQYTSNLKHDLSCWEKKAKTALAELKWANENEKHAATTSPYEEEEEEESEEEDDSEDDDYSGSCESSSSGEYIDEDDYNSSDEDDEDDEDDEEEDTSSSGSDEEVSESSGTPKESSNTGGGSFFFDAVSNMTNMLIPVSASTSSTQPVTATRKQSTNIPQQHTEFDEQSRSNPRHVESPHHTLMSSSSPSSSPEMNPPAEMTSLAQKIKSHPSRRRTTSTPGLKQQTISPTSSPITTPLLDATSTVIASAASTISSLNSLNLNDEEASRCHPTQNLPAASSSQDKPPPPPPTGATVGVDEATVAPPKSPTRFQNFKSNVLRRSKSSDGGSEEGSGGGGGGRIGFSRRYITSKLERRKAKIMKAKECHYLHKQIIKSSK